MGEEINALFAGLSIIDIQMFVEAYPKPNTKTRTDKYEITTGGPATNAAITCAFLGAKTTLISPVGKHYFTHSIIDSIKEHKVTLVDPVEDKENEPLIASIITDENNGERTIFSFNPPKLEFDKSVLNNFEFSGFSIGLFDGFYPELSIEIAKKLKELNIPLILDGGSWKPQLEKLLPFIDIAICSNDFYPPGTTNEMEVIKALLDFGIQKIAITRGNMPIIMGENDIIREIPVRKIKCKDTLGAGDIIHGAFCYFYAKGYGFEYSLTEASKIASFSCLHKGTRQWMRHYKTITETTNNN